ncbi:hypothetical protein QJS04_geneDACA015818 [Acorus gramineus]|uniref:WD repeat-containing protein 6 n=1 Tax=Acorus gramineus TaxID=55184 RepID=A0AAV9BL27_ACOGR|nr:hypothetical protein QJS04_geneDACA015818 [Acorus gramineus]
MRLWGDDVEELRVASGTIYNEIIIWKLARQGNISSTSSSKVTDNSNSPGSKDTQFLGQQYSAINLSKLIGHEGSIFRIVWSSDGSKIVSVSDDRSARIWMVGFKKDVHDNLREVLHTHVSADVVLFGHNARIWDCYISDSTVITAGEDCTCRVWAMNGSQRLMVKEHSGRGIWRCLYDPNSSLLVTAGFDSTIKVHKLHSSLLSTSEQKGMLNEFKDSTEFFTICMPNVAGQGGFMDSKSEYIRCLHFTRHDVLYVSTNNGYLYHVKLFNPGDATWTELVQIHEKGPIICMDLMSVNSSGLSTEVEVMIVVGDSKGYVTMVGVIADACTPKVAFSFKWEAESERQLLDTFWCKSLGCSYLFTANPRGRLRLWRIHHPLRSVTDEETVEYNVSLIAEFLSCFGTRIMCLDTSLETEMLICGDKRGNMIVFHLPKNLLLADSKDSGVTISPLTIFKGAHGISSVTSISVTSLYSNKMQIRTTGGDGCICYFENHKGETNIEFIGMKQVKESSTIQSLFSDSSLEEENMEERYAIGFASADFIIWNLIDESKIAQVPCGGWRRPYSYYLGELPEIQNSFAFVKDHTIHVHRLWIPTGERQLFHRILRMQYHGREIHSLCFVSINLHVKPHRSSDLWVATGCEDGTVRLTRYSPFQKESWFESKLLGEHVGGSAVRSICFVSPIAGQTSVYDESHVHQVFPSDCEVEDFLLISVGSKQVLTSWLLRSRRLDSNKEQVLNKTFAETGNACNMPFEESQSLFFQWFSTHMPPKFPNMKRNTTVLTEGVGRNANASIMDAAPKSKTHEELKPNNTLKDKNENDWRYLSVTAFIVKSTRLSVCFIAVACSDATLTLRALLMPSRLWFDVALLVPQTSPVLTLHHVIVPTFSTSKGNIHIGSLYFVVSGSTDGTITFWDLTETVECFMQWVVKTQPEKLIDCRRRPQTGRGSQGGRWRRSLNNQSPSTVLGTAMNTGKNRADTSQNDPDKIVSGASSELGSAEINTTTASKAMNTNNYFASTEIHEIRPTHIINSVHQSGVNCLHVSEIKDGQDSRSKSTFCVLSGGDDQAIHCVGFYFEQQAKNFEVNHQTYDVKENLHAETVSQSPELGCNGNSYLCGSNKEYRVRVLYCNKIASAHSSAVKGIWTDGTWAFSVGLDQRVRCWHLGNGNGITEEAHIIISVPEPEALDVRILSGNQYRIAVSGRGMQMVEFLASSDDDEPERSLS